MSSSLSRRPSPIRTRLAQEIIHRSMVLRPCVYLSCELDDTENGETLTHLPSYDCKVLQRCKTTHLHTSLITQLTECALYVILVVDDEGSCDLHYAKIKHVKFEYYLHNRLQVERNLSRRKQISSR